MTTQREDVLAGALAALAAKFTSAASCEIGFKSYDQVGIGGMPWIGIVPLHGHHETSPYKADRRKMTIAVICYLAGYSTAATRIAAASTWMAGITDALCADEPCLGGAATNVDPTEEDTNEADLDSRGALWMLLGYEIVYHDTLISA